MKKRNIPHCRNRDTTLLEQLQYKNHRKIIITHIYMTAHFPGLVQAL